MANTLSGSILQLVQSWWRQDRIRVSRNCGQLLTLAVGDRLLLDDHVYIIIKRWTDRLEHAIPTHVGYLLREDTDECAATTIETGEKTMCRFARLIIPIEQTQEIRLCYDSHQRDLLPEDVVCVSRRC